MLKNNSDYYWSKGEDEKLEELVREKGTEKWKEISEEFYFKEKQFISASKCRERWFNFLCPNIRKEEWKEEDDAYLLRLIEEHGRKWAKIARIMGNERSEHVVKNRFISLSKKRKSEDQVKVEEVKI